MVSLFFSGCFIFGGGGRGGAALRVRCWRGGGIGGEGRAEIGRGRPDWDGLVWETEGLSERGSGGGGAFLLTFVGPDLVLLRPRHETAWELLPLVSAPAFASFFFSWLPTTPDNGASGAVHRHRAFPFGSSLRILDATVSYFLPWWYLSCLGDCKIITTVQWIQVIKMSS